MIVSAEGHGSFNDLIHHWRALLGGGGIIYIDIDIDLMLE
jgi:hypothetical protein